MSSNRCELLEIVLEECSVGGGRITWKGNEKRGGFDDGELEMTRHGLTTKAESAPLRPPPQ